MVSETVNFDSCEAQSAIWERLRRIQATGRVGSAYLFAGPRGCGKEALAIEFAMCLNCQQPGTSACGLCATCRRFKTLQHEHLKLIVPLPAGKATATQDVLKSLSAKDLEFLTRAIQHKAQDPFYKIKVPKASRIRINSIRELRRTLYLKAQIQGRKMVLIFEAHLLSLGQGEAGNALLKILEEPPPNSTLILVTDHKSALLPTILSRCQQIDFPPLKKEAIQAYLIERQVDAERARFFALLAEGDMHRARALSPYTIVEIEALIKSLVQTVSAVNGSTWRSFINRYARMASTNAEEFKFHFYLLQYWFKSSYRLRAGVPDDLQDTLREELQRFQERYPDCDLQRIDTLIETAMNALARNFYLPLTLINLLLNIQHCLNNESRLTGLALT